MQKNLVWVLTACAVVLFIVAIIGIASSSSHRWVEPVEAAGWMFFVGVVLVSYLGGSSPDLEMSEYPAQVGVAWGLGALAIILFLISIITSAVSTAKTHPGWIEAIELAGILSIVALILVVVVTSRSSKSNEPR